MPFLPTNDIDCLNLIALSWRRRMRDVRCDADWRMVQFRMACDLAVVTAILAWKRRARIAAIINDTLRFAVIASQAANLLLLVMVVTGWARPWPTMQFGLATLVMLTVALDWLWTARWLDQVLGNENT